MVHIQNATLAGGVAMGAASNMRVAPVLAVLIGVAAGLLSTWGYHVLSDKLRSGLNLDDTCGVNNLHGMPGILGAIISAIVLLASDKDAYGNTWGAIVADDRSGGGQAGFQLVTMGVTVVIALATGALTGKIAGMVTGLGWPLEAFADHPLWEVPDDYVSTGQAAGEEANLTPRGAARNHCATAFPDLELANLSMRVANTSGGAGAGASVTPAAVYAPGPEVQDD